MWSSLLTICKFSRFYFYLTTLYSLGTLMDVKYNFILPIKWFLLTIKRQSSQPQSSNAANNLWVVDTKFGHMN